MDALAAELVELLRTVTNDVTVTTSAPGRLKVELKPRVPVGIAAAALASHGAVLWVEQQAVHRLLGARKNQF